MKKIIISTLLLFVNTVFAQEEIDFDNTELFINNVISSNEGTVINLFTIEYNNEKIPISLFNSQKGIKVNEKPSSVGLGWKLQDIGFINHTVNYACDFNNYKGWFYTLDPDFSNNFTVSYFNPLFYNPPGNNPAGPYVNDLSPDYFSLHTINGIRTDFIYKKNIVNNSVVTPSPELLNSNEDLKILTYFNNQGINAEHNTPINYTTVFDVLDNKGNKYAFLNGPSLYGDNNSGVYKYGPHNMKNNFYLKRISNATNAEYIDIEYSRNDYELQDVYYALGYNRSLGTNSNNDDDFNNNIIHSERTNKKYQIDNSKFEIKKITTDDSIIEFSYSIDKYLTEISIKDTNNNYITRFVFEYLDLYIDNYNNVYVKNLHKIKKYNSTGITSETIYEFEYYNNEGQTHIAPTEQEQISQLYTDFFGYYNAEQQKETPFNSPVRAYNPYQIKQPGNSQPNLNYAVSNSLFKIKNLYHGTTEFTYQLKKGFNYEGREFYGGGLIVSTIKKNPIAGDAMYTKYEYENLIGFSQYLDVIAARCKQFGNKKYFSTILELTDAQDFEDGQFMLQNVHKDGNFYGTITESQLNFETMALKSKKISHFLSNSEGIYKTPLIIEELFINSQNEQIKKKEYTYDRQTIETIDAAEYIVESRDNPDFTDADLFVGGGTIVYISTFNKERKNRPVYINRVKLIDITSTLFSPTGNMNNKKTFSYINPKSNILRNIKSQINNSNDYIEELFYYPHDTTMSFEPQVAPLIQNNILIPIKIETFNGVEKTSEQITKYSSFVSTIPNSPYILPQYIYSKKGTDANATLEKKLTYDLYDDKGNVLQYTKENGASNVVIWGYNKTKPIAEIQNMAYSNITSYVTNLQSLSNADNDTCTSGTCNEQLLRNALNSLRTTLASSYPNARMTTYTYNPLIGVTSVTDAKSDVQYYIYDSFQRLVKVIDKDGKIVSEKEYNYKPQN